MQIRRWFELGVALAVLGIAAKADAPTGSRGSQPMQMSAMTVHNIFPEAAAGSIPLQLNAVVTYYDPYIDTRHAAMFVHDSSGGVFVSLPSRPTLPVKIGDRVLIDGVTGSGDFAPVVVGNSVRVIGHNQMPTHARLVTLAEMRSGVTDGQWVAFEGRVRSVHSLSNNVVMDVASAGGSVVAVTVRQPGAKYDALIDSLVRVQGSAAPLFNQRRQMVGCICFLGLLTRSRFSRRRPTTHLKHLSFLSQNFSAIRLLPSSCTAFTCEGGSHWTGRDAGYAFRTVRTESAWRRSKRRILKWVRSCHVVGFPAVLELKPTIEDTSFRVLGPPEKLQPWSVRDGEALKADLDGQVIQLNARLIGQDLAADESKHCSSRRITFDSCSSSQGRR